MAAARTPDCRTGGNGGGSDVATDAAAAATVADDATAAAAVAAADAAATAVATNDAVATAAAELVRRLTGATTTAA